jgi:replicative DNA helicase
VQRLHCSGKPTDLLTVTAWLTDHDLLVRIGGRNKLATLVDRTVSAVNIDALAELVMDKFVRRQLIKAGNEIVHLGYETETELPQILDQSEQKIFQLSNQTLSSNTEHNSTINVAAYEDLNSGNPIYPTGLHELDNLMVGFESGTLTIVAGRPSMGKCCHFNTEIVLRDGSLCTIQELVQRKQGEVITLGDDWKVHFCTPSDFINSGIKPVFRVTTRLGRFVETTITHPYLTINGWKPLANLKCGDKIAVPRQLDIFGEETLRACEVKLLGYLIGDGCLSVTNMVQFANNNPAIGTDFVEAILGFSPSLKVQMDSLEKRAIRYCVSRDLEFTTAQRKIFAECLASFMKSSANTTWTQKELAKAINVTPALVSQWVQGNCVPNQTTFVKLCQALVVEPEEIAPYGILAITKNAKNLLSLWLQELGLNGKTSHSKVVPSIVFQLKREQVALFLNRLFATDGWATVLKSGQSQLGYATVNEKLARQVQHLLLRFGIIAALKKRYVKYKDHRRIAWQLDITDAKSLKIFIDEIGIFGKEKALSSVKEALALKKYKTNRDLIPVDIWKQIAAAKENESWAVLARRAGIKGSSNMHIGKRAPTRERLLQIATALDNLHLQQIATSDVYWDEIVSIEPIGNHQVYDLTIPETHNFIANDICVHNSQIALFLAFQMILFHELPVVIFSLEMTKKQLEYRLWSLISVSNAYKHLELTPLKSDRIRRHRSGNKPLADWEFTSIAKIVSVASELPLYMNDSRGITVSQIASECRQIKAKEGKLGLVVVDYLQMMAEDSGGNRSYELGDVARGLYKMAGELDVPVLALSQISRGVEGRQNKRPMMSDLSQSGILEMVADNIILAYRDEYYNIILAYRDEYYNSDTTDQGILELIMAKARHGETGTATVFFDKSYGIIQNLRSRNI